MAAKNNNKNVKMSQMNEQSVLAERYIPAEFRHINHFPITTPFVAVRATPLGPENLAPKFLLPVPKCCCAQPHSTSTSAPVRTIALELRYGLMLPQTCSKAGQRPPPSWPTVGNISDLVGYCKTFEKLLWEERSQILRIYQSYSQYNLPVTIPITTTVPSLGARRLSRIRH